jgi:hypothetical protein
MAIGGDQDANMAMVEAALDSLAGIPNFVHVRTFTRLEWLGVPS